jgi:hypothetical protein
VVVVLKNSFSCEVEMFCCQALSHVFAGLLRSLHINKKQWEPELYGSFTTQVPRNVATACTDFLVDPSSGSMDANDLFFLVE